MAPANLDFLAAPIGWAARWEARLRHRSWPADHACLVAAPRSTAAATAAPRCTPAIMSAMPEAALADLRGRFHTLTLLCDIPLRLGAAPDFSAPVPTPQVGVLHGPEATVAADIPFAADEEIIPFLPSLAQWGRPALDAMIASWWRVWRRSTSKGDPHRARA